MRFLLTAGFVCLLAQPLAAAVHLKARTIEALSARSEKLNHHFIIQFRSAPTPETRAELERRGIRVVAYVPDNAVMASSHAVPDLEGLDVEWTGNLAPSDKLSPELSAAASGAYLLMLHEDVARPAGLKIAQRLGFFVLDRPGLVPGHLVIAGPAQNLAELAAHDEVAYILPASPDLLTDQPLIGCVGSLTPAGRMGPYAAAAQGWIAAADGMVHLNFVFETLTPKVEENALRSEMGRALGEWAQYANVTFSAAGTPSSPRTVAIRFASGEHGDGFPFDGPGKVLAHSFYPAPPNSEPIAGDMHLDADEDWRIGANIDLFSVALHEAGHTLGLGHTDKPGSVMYPYYRLVTGLSPDDIAAIRNLYGSKAPVTPPGPAQPPTGPPSAPGKPIEPPPAADRTPPSLRVVSPASSIVSTTSGSMTFSGTAVDNVGVAAVRWSTSTGKSGTASGTTNWSAEVPLLIGDTVVTIRAYDAAGNSAWKAITVVRH